MSNSHLNSFLEVAVDNWKHEEGTCTAEDTKASQDRSGIMRLEIHRACRL